MISPVPKQINQFVSKSPLPVLKYDSLQKIWEYSNQPKRYGICNGFNVTVEGNDDISALCSMGNFGVTLLTHEHLILKKKKNKHSSVANFNDMNETICSKMSDKKNCLNLMLEEAFFLAFALNCLVVSKDDHDLSITDMWILFQKIQPNFLERYITYHYFRAKGWVVKSGLKFGGDFLLYKEGPQFYHGSFVVIVMSNISEMKNPRSFSSFFAINRAVEAVRKELLICRIFIPTNLNHTNVSHISLCEVSEFVFKRWIASEHREAK